MNAVEFGEYQVVPIEKLKPLDVELRIMTPEEFNLLCQSIREGKFTEPLRVVKDGDVYRILDGNHRYLALRDVFKAREVPCIVLGEMGKEYDELRFWQEAIRVNNIKGEFNPAALTKKVIEIYEKLKHRYDPDEIKRKLGFAGKKTAFEKIVQQVEKTLPAEMRRRFREAAREIGSIEDLSKVLNTLFQQYGKTLDCNFMLFVWGGRECVMVRCDSELWSLVKLFFEQLEAKKQDARAVFKAFFKRELGVA
jgi:ParB-like chromosome segregation protein Spo0J